MDKGILHSSHKHHIMVLKLLDHVQSYVLGMMPKVASNWNYSLNTYSRYYIFMDPSEVLYFTFICPYMYICWRGGKNSDDQTVEGADAWRGRCNCSPISVCGPPPRHPPLGARNIFNVKSAYWRAVKSRFEVTGVHLRPKDAVVFHRRDLE